jgi:hypothetical protein
MITREQFEQRRQQWESFNRWEAQQPPIERAPADILADLGTIWSWLPSEVRGQDPDPQKIGIQKMRAALALLKLRS